MEDSNFINPIKLVFKDSNNQEDDEELSP